MSISPVPDNYKPKSFWQKPEGKGGWALIAAVGVGVFYLWGTIVPFVLSTIASTFWLTIYGIALFALLDVLFGITGVGKTINMLVSNLFKSLARGLTSIFVTIDPIGILQNALEEMRDERNKLIQMIERFSGTLANLKRELGRMTSEYKTFAAEADQAKRMAANESDPVKQQKLLLASQTKYGNAGLAKSGIENLTNLAREAESMLKGFQTWDNIAEAKIDRFEYKIGHLKQQRKVTLDAQKALSIGRRLLRGNSEQMQMVDMATEYLAEDAARTVGEMREFSRFTDKLHLEQTISNAASAETIAAELAQFNERLLSSANELQSSDEFRVPGSNVTVMQPRTKSAGADFDPFA